MKQYDHAKILAHKMEVSFSEKQSREEALGILMTYGGKKIEPEPDRVRLAILKLSGSDMECLQETTKNAKQDYRDVLAWAESPNQNIAGSLPEGKKKERLRQADQEQFENWVNTD